MIKCNEIVTELNGYCKNDISPELKTKIIMHLDTCESCRQELESLQRLDELLDKYQMPAVTAGFESRFQRRLADEEAKRAKYRYILNINWRRVGLYASAAIVLVALTVWLINPFNYTTTSTEDEIINNLELLEHLENVQEIDFINDYELVEAFPEIMEIDLIE